MAFLCPTALSSLRSSPHRVPEQQQRIRFPLAQRMHHFHHLAARPRMKSRESGKNIRLFVGNGHKFASYQVVSQQLHDQCRILVAFLAQSV